MAQGENARNTGRKELWQPRPLSSAGIVSCKSTKVQCHRIERRMHQISIREELDEMHFDDIGQSQSYYDLDEDYD